jgi:phosphohistidine phosphatase SixA
MDPPAITRYRRPFFLAPLWLTFLGALLLAVLGYTVYRSAGITVVLLVRTTDKDPGTIADPPISAEGEDRAQRLAQIFGATAPAVDAVYASGERRSQQMAAPVAARLGRAPIVLATGDPAAAASRVLREHSNGTVLVVAGGPGFGQLLHELADVDAGVAAQDEAGVLYLISIPTFGRTHVVRLKL